MKTSLTLHLTCILVLSRVKTFLPMMQAAEAELSARISKQPGVSVDIEDVKEDEQHVEMVIIDRFSFM